MASDSVSRFLLPGLLLVLVVDGYTPSYRWRAQQQQQQQQQQQVRHRPTCRGGRRVVRAADPSFLDALSDEVVRESANAASNVGKLGWEGAKQTRVEGGCLANCSPKGIGTRSPGLWAQSLGAQPKTS